MKKLRVRIRVAFGVLFGRYSSWVLLRVPKGQLADMVSGGRYDIEMSMHGLREYNVICLCRAVEKAYSFEEKACLKAEHEALMDINVKNRNK